MIYEEAFKSSWSKTLTLSFKEESQGSEKNCPQTWYSKSDIRAGGIFFAIYISVVIIMKYTWF